MMIPFGSYVPYADNDLCLSFTPFGRFAHRLHQQTILKCIQTKNVVSRKHVLLHSHLKKHMGASTIPIGCLNNPDLIEY